MNRVKHFPTFATPLTTRKLSTQSHSQSRSPRRSPWQAKAIGASKTAIDSFRLAPSDFAFLWDECKRCFYLKAHKQLYRPRAPFPSIFSTIDTGMKRHFRGLNTTGVIPEMKPGTFLCEDNDAWLECQPITPPGHSQSVYIRGMVDCLVRFDDNTYGIIDFKTSSTAKSSKTYSRQLHAYAYALENPSNNSELEQATVSDLGLIIYTPTAFHTPLNRKRQVAGALTGELTYIQIPRDNSSFQSFLTQVLDVLTLPKPPPPPPGKGKFSSCPYCQYLHEASHKNLI